VVQSTTETKDQDVKQDDLSPIRRTPVASIKRLPSQ